MKNRDKIKSIYNNILVSEELDNKILNETIYKEKFNNKKLILKYAIIFIVFASFTTIGVVAKDYIKEFIINWVDDGSGGASVSIDMEGKVLVAKDNNLICNKDLTIQDVEEGLKIKLLKTNFYNKDTFDKCSIKKDKKGNIKRVAIENDDNFHVDFAKEQKVDRNKKYLNLKIEFMTNYADNIDEEYFKEYLMLKGSKKGLEDITEEYYIENLNIKANIVIWLSEETGWPNTFCFFIYNNVIYNIEGLNITKTELIDILENLKY